MESITVRASELPFHYEHGSSRREKPYDQQCYEGYQEYKEFVTKPPTSITVVVPDFLAEARREIEGHTSPESSTIQNPSCWGRIFWAARSIFSFCRNNQSVLDERTTNLANEKREQFIQKTKATLDSAIVLFNQQMHDLQGMGRPFDTLMRLGDQRILNENGLREWKKRH